MFGYIGRLVGFFLLLFFLPYSESFALRWQMTPELLLGETYNDNIYLRPPGQEESSNISELTPGVRLFGKGQGIDLSARYTLQNHFYHGIPEDDKNYTKAAVNMRAELIQDRLFFESNGIYTQATIATQGLNIDDLAVTQSRQNVYQYLFSPTVKHPIGDYFLTELKYSHEEIRYPKLNQVELIKILRGSVETNPRINRFQSRISLQRQDREISNVKYQFDEYLYRGKLNISSRLQTYLELGYENNRGLSSASTAGGYNSEGGIFFGGYIWKPVPRIILEMGAGKKYFGRRYLLRYVHQVRRFNWQVGYNVDTEPSNILRLNEQLLNNSPNPIQFGQGVAGISSELLIPTSALSVRKRWDASLTFNARHNSLSIGGFLVNQDFDDIDKNTTARNVEYYGGTAQWTLEVSDKSSVFIRGLQQIYKNEGSGAIAQPTTREILGQISAGIERRLSARMNMQLSSNHTEKYRRDDPEKQEQIQYRNNSYILKISMDF